MINVLTLLVSRLLGIKPKPKAVNRALDSTEKLMVEQTQKQRLIISSVIFVDSKKALELRHIRSALHRLMRRHPLLRMRVYEYAGERYWCEMDVVDPQVNVDNSTDWHAVLSATCEKPIDVQTGPMWHVTYMPRAHCAYYDNSYEHHAAFVFGFSHAIIDGQGKRPGTTTLTG